MVNNCYIKHAGEERQRQRACLSADRSDSGKECESAECEVKPPAMCSFVCYVHYVVNNKVS